MTTASSTWQSPNEPAAATCVRPRGMKRVLEIVGIVFLLFHAWPAALAYIAWKLAGYPGLGELRRFAERGFERPFGEYRFAGPSNPFRNGAPFGGSGNRAFDEYRRQEIDRLEQERRRLDEEAREFRAFVDDLKKAKDREEFDAYMARRRQNGPTTA